MTQILDSEAASEYPYIIYEAQNKLNGKVYVGLTTTTLEKRKKAHLNSAKRDSKSHFHKAIRKYGEDNFEWYVMMTTKSLDTLYKLEIMTIASYEAWQTYNISLGGEHPAYGMKHSEETKQLCGEYAKKRWDDKRASDKYPEEAFLCDSYKEANAKYNVPKTTWYRERKILKEKACVGSCEIVDLT